MDCPICHSRSVKNGTIITKRGELQRYICRKAHTFYALKDYVVSYTRPNGQVILKKALDNKNIGIVK